MKRMNIFTDEEVAEYNRKRRGLDNIIEAPGVRRNYELIKKNIRPIRRSLGLPYPPFRYYLDPIDPDEPHHLVLEDVNPEKWRRFKEQYELIYRALFASDDEIPEPRWECFTPLEHIAYFLSFHVYDELNSHPRMISHLKQHGLLPDNPNYGAPPLFYMPLETPEFPWTRFSELLIKPALPIIEEYMKPLTATRKEHGWLVRDVFTCNEALYKLAEPLHDELRRAVPPDAVDRFLSYTGGNLVLKRTLNSDCTYFKDPPPPGTWEYEFERWMNYERDTCPTTDEFPSVESTRVRGTYVDNEPDDEDAPKKTKPKKASKPAPEPALTKPNKPNSDSLF